MKKIFSVFVIMLLFTSCKSDKKDQDINTTKETLSETEKTKKVKKTFEDRLLDLRDVNKKFNENFVVEKFGMQKVNDTLSGFVFKLDQLTTDETVKMYSIGVRGFNSDLKKPYQTSFLPEIKVIDKSKYLILRRKLGDITYFDSLDVFIFERKNWKKSGRLGSIKIRDVLFE